MRRCYVSYKTEDLPYAYEVLGLVPGAFIRPPGSGAECYEDGRPLEDIREEILQGSEVTIHLIGRYSAECLGSDEQRFIKRELQASLCKAKNGLCSGVLGIVLPEAAGAIFKGTYRCPECGKRHEHIIIDDSTVAAEFSRNYFTGCGGENGYCVLLRWEVFIACPDRYIEEACARRFSPAVRLKGDKNVQ